MRFSIGISLLCTASLVYAGIDLGWKDDGDLTNFVTRPELRAPLYAVTFYKPELVTPGYWFVAPYTEINQRASPPKFYQPCQVGPHIFDAYGTLIWSGACQVKNQNTCDFRAWQINGSDYLSAILYKSPTDPIGRGFLMNNSYQVVDEIFTAPEQQGMNMHELEFLHNGTTAIHITARTEVIDTAEIPEQDAGVGWIYNMGFREVDLRTKKTVFEWWAYPEVALNESTVAVDRDVRGPPPYGWNWFHANAVVKNDAGDYLISSRFTNTIFKISGKDGRIIWRLGGIRSDFELRGFNFSRQHDPQWISSDSRTEILTFLDNGSDGITHTSNISTAYKIQLNLENMTAEVLQEWVRPDGRRSDLRGNFQTLPSGNVFASWSDNSVISEHTSEGDLVMTAAFLSERTVTYRAYKFNFTGAPSEPPVLKAFAYGAEEGSSTTVAYMSWNGATEVEGWRVYGLAGKAEASNSSFPTSSKEGKGGEEGRGQEVEEEEEEGHFVGSIWKMGFETRFQIRGYEARVYAEAVDVDGKVLGRTNTFTVEAPPEWQWEWDELDAIEVTEPAPRKIEQQSFSVKTEL